jgi:hypothetical protein
MAIEATERMALAMKRFLHVGCSFISLRLCRKFEIRAVFEAGLSSETVCVTDGTLLANKKVSKAAINPNAPMIA